MDADKIFSTFFASDRGGSPFSMFFDDDFGMSFGSGGGGGSSTKLFRTMGAPGGVQFGNRGGAGGFGAGGAAVDHQEAPKRYQIDLNVTLEELYT